MYTYFSSRWLSPRLTGFMVDNPEIALRIEPINVATDLDGRDVDLAIVWSFDGPPTPDAKLIYASASYSTVSPAVAQAIEEKGFDVVRQRTALLFDSSGDQGWRHWFKLTVVTTVQARPNWNSPIPIAAYRRLSMARVSPCGTD